MESVGLKCGGAVGSFQEGTFFYKFVFDPVTLIKHCLIRSFYKAFIDFIYLWHIYPIFLQKLNDVYITPSPHFPPTTLWCMFILRKNVFLWPKRQVLWSMDRQVKKEWDQLVTSCLLPHWLCLWEFDKKGHKLWTCDCKIRQLS